ncbi:MAG: hypothetical protein ABR600_03620 [Actinomycetota bacterium]
MWREGDHWYGRLDARGAETHALRSRKACVERLRRGAGKAVLTIEVVPDLVGVAEAAAILGWDKRRIFTYISRDSFPEAVALLASGRVWRRADVEEYARDRRRRRS